MSPGLPFGGIDRVRLAAHAVFLLRTERWATRFTPFALAWALCGRALASRAVFTSGYSCLLASAASFYSSEWLYPGAHGAMARRFHLRQGDFQVLNFAVHVLPLLALATPALWTPSLLYNGAGCVGQLAWGAWVSGGTFDLSASFVPLPSWHVLWSIAAVSHMLPVAVRWHW